LFWWRDEVERGLSRTAERNKAAASYIRNAHHVNW
jgi:hypothetical protein